MEKALILVLPADAKGKEKAASKKAKAESDPVGPPGEGGLYVGSPKQWGQLSPSLIAQVLGREVCLWAGESDFPKVQELQPPPSCSSGPFWGSAPWPKLTQGSGSLAHHKGPRSRQSQDGALYLPPSEPRDSELAPPQTSTRPSTSVSLQVLAADPVKRKPKEKTAAEGKAPTKPRPPKTLQVKLAKAPSKAPPKGEAKTATKGKARPKAGAEDEAEPPVGERVKGAKGSQAKSQAGAPKARAPKAGKKAVAKSKEKEAEGGAGPENA